METLIKKDTETLLINGQLNPDYMKGKLVKKGNTIGKVKGFDIKNIKRPLNQVEWKVQLQDGDIVEWKIDDCQIIED